MNPDALLDLLRRFPAEGVAYVLVGGYAVRLNGFNRDTDDIDILLPSSLENGRRVQFADASLHAVLRLPGIWFRKIDFYSNSNIALHSASLCKLKWLHTTRSRSRLQEFIQSPSRL